MDLSHYQSMDINLLLSIINMKLRDEADDLKDLCLTYQLDQQLLTERLSQEDYVYDSSNQQFKRLL